MISLFVSPISSTLSKSSSVSSSWLTLLFCFSKAANLLGSTPGALHLRTLATLNDISSDQSNTIVFALPIEVLRALEGKKDK